MVVNMYWAWNKIQDEFAHLLPHQRKRARRLKRGKCSDCGRVRVSKRYCEKHLAVRRVREMERYIALALADGDKLKARELRKEMKFELRLVQHFKDKGWD